MDTTSGPLTQGRLDALRRGVPGCEVVLAADIVAATVLAVSGTVRLPQESHDELCAQAADLLAGGAARAVLCRPTGTRVFVRAPFDGDVALALVLPPEADPAPALERAGALMAEAP